MMDYINCFLTDYDNFAMSFSFSKVKVKKNNTYWATTKINACKI